jgi:hypothetical protein
VTIEGIHRETAQSIAGSRKELAFRAFEALSRSGEGASERLRLVTTAAALPGRAAVAFVVGLSRRR